MCPLLICNDYKSQLLCTLLIIMYYITITNKYINLKNNIVEMCVHLLCNDDKNVFLYFLLLITIYYVTNYYIQ